MTATVHATKVGNVTNVDFLFLGKSEVTRVSDELNGYSCALVVLEYAGGYMWLAAAKAYTPRFSLPQRHPWHDATALGAPKVGVRNNGKTCQNRVVWRADSAPQVQRRCSVAYSIHANGMVERMMREIVLASTSLYGRYPSGSLQYRRRSDR